MWFFVVAKTVEFPQLQLVQLPQLQFSSLWSMSLVQLVPLFWFSASSAGYDGEASLLAWDKASSRRVQGCFISLSFRERIAPHSPTLLQLSLQSSIISWADWKLMRSLQLGSDSQVIRGLHAVGEFAGRVYGSRLGGNSLLDYAVLFVSMRLVVKVFLPMMLTVLRGIALCRRREIHCQLLPVPRCCWVFLHAQGLDQQLLRFLRRQPQLLPVQFEGHGSQCSLCSYTSAGLWRDS